MSESGMDYIITFYLKKCSLKALKLEFIPVYNRSKRGIGAFFLKTLPVYDVKIEA